MQEQKWNFLHFILQENFSYIDDRVKFREIRKVSSVKMFMKFTFPAVSDI